MGLFVSLFYNINIVDKKKLGLGFIGRNGKDGWPAWSSNQLKAQEWCCIVGFLFYTSLSIKKNGVTINFILVNNSLWNEHRGFDPMVYHIHVSQLFIYAIIKLIVNLRNQALSIVFFTSIWLFLCTKRFL